jgi:hypothetical protein
MIVIRAVWFTTTLSGQGTVPVRLRVEAGLR